MNRVDRGTPLFFVLVQPEGRPEAERVDATFQITSFSFEDSEKKADLLKLEVDNWDLANFDSPVWKPGNLLIVTWGYAGLLAPKRTCVIQKVKGSVKLSVEAQAQSVLMNKIVYSKTYENTRRSEIVHAIAKSYGYADDARFIEETETVYEHVVQAQATDAQFIKQLAEKEHFEFYVDHQGFHWHSRNLAQKSLRVMQWFTPPAVGDILAFDVENDIFAKPGKVTTKGRDPLAKKDVGGDGSNGETERKALSPIVHVIDKASGQITQQLRTANEDTRPTTATSTAEAKKDADGAYKRSVLATVKLDVDAVGDPGVVAKSVLDIRGISKRLSGKYYVNAVTHTIDGSGYKMKIKCSTDGTGGHFENLLDADKEDKKKDAPIKPPITPAMVEECKRTLAAKTAELQAAAPSWKGRGNPLPADATPEAKKLAAECSVLEDRCVKMQNAVGRADVKDEDLKGKDTSTRRSIDPASGKQVLSYHPEGAAGGADPGTKK